MGKHCLHEYNESNKVYVSAGRSALLPASNTLHVNVSKFVKKEGEGLKFDHEKVSGFNPDVDFASIIPPTSVPATSPSSADLDQSDPFIVEQIITKRFNSHKVQYEYLVKWLGYSSTENTWELPTNIPPDLLNKYENSIITKQRSGRTSKAPSKPDFIVNM